MESTLSPSAGMGSNLDCGIASDPTAKHASFGPVSGLGLEPALPPQLVTQAYMQEAGYSIPSLCRATGNAEGGEQADSSKHDPSRARLVLASTRAASLAPGIPNMNKGQWRPSGNHGNLNALLLTN
ncbi:uncharacterized protein PAN0_016c5255 [Moesziomyces antarcticus]|uniref:Uncharacterized protein n=2 Tax=Pseudozyma antarctica TaxID=84753 RepID=A0A5C3FX13_PSEA2|nr:uncharacterized protein PAN0_016c5255 [Moesziomyces antarcticus]GAK67029.1 hypothetical protein PAN0_016c5255 [Moesziomyces antarcticus]SPO48275.1 uncharacterized protein PSANT_05964 [Moesziomyces antarcticus]